ncbi:MAG: gliding motility-associated C-terminal domain-containing protein [Chitinophagales bacterium]
MNQYQNYFYFILCLLFADSLQANIAAMGADISYTCVEDDVSGNNGYEFVVNLYYLCNSENPLLPSAEIQLSVSSSNCDQNFTFQLPRKNAQGIEVTPLCEIWTDSSTCHNNRFPGVLQYQYTNIESAFGVLTLPCEANDWVIGLNEVCRNETITNLQDPSNQALYIEAIINNKGGICNSSPTFGPISIPYQIPVSSPLAVPYYCMGIETVFDQGVINDGDELEYRLAQPRRGGGNGDLIPYVGNLSQINPMSNTDFDFGADFDSQTGEIRFTANEAQSAVISIVIEERSQFSDEKIGSVMRDMQFIVIDCSNNQVQVEEGIDKTIEVCPNELVQIDITVTDSDEEDLLQISTEMLDQLWGATLVNTTGSSPLTATFEWAPTVNDLGIHNLLFHIRDDACPAYSQLTQTYQVIVTQDISLQTKEYTYCATEPLGMLSIDLEGCGPFEFFPMPSEVIEEDGRIIGIVPNLEADTYVISNAEGDSEEMYIEYISEFEVNFTSDESLLCEGESTSLSITSSNDALVCDAVFFEQVEGMPQAICETCPMVSPNETTVYTVEFTCENGCEKREELLITVEPKPTLSLVTSNLTLSSGGSLVTLTAMGDFDSVEWETGEMSTSIEVLVEALISIEATAYSESGCSTTESVTLIYNCGDIHMPTAFSPNDDLINDEFGIEIPVEELVRFSIYNRWGKPVFQTNDPNEAWDGMVGFEPQPVGVYVYYIEVVCRGELKVNQGYVTLIR